HLASPMRRLEILADRFGAFEAAAVSTIKLARLTGRDELSMEPNLAEALLQFGHELREASEAADEWARAKGLIA
ncbi:MAG TPA: hypothetical protein VEY93_11575, partial [Longimicrobium sp.]|nr:hypothetical protein [Longimicrobium sp.]